MTGLVTFVLTAIAWWRFGVAWALVVLLLCVAITLFATGRRVQGVLDARNEMDIRFSDYEYCDVIGTEGPRNATVLQGAFLVHNLGPDSDFEAWIPYHTVDWSGPGSLYGGFHSCWALSTSFDERRRWIQRGSAERVDVVLVNSASRMLQFLGPGRRGYMGLPDPSFVVTGTIHIRDVNRDGAYAATSFKLTYQPEDGFATFRVPANAVVQYGSGGLPIGEPQRGDQT